MSLDRFSSISGQSITKISREFWFAIGFSLASIFPLCAAEPETYWFPGADGVQRPFSGIGTCRRCHANQRAATTSTEQPMQGDDIEFLTRLEQGEWVLFTEMTIWTQYDKHFQAFAVLSNEQSKHMGKLLGSPDVTRDVRCLACHTGVPVQQLPTEAPGVLAALEATHPLLQDLSGGVSCEGCHGPASDVAGNQADGAKGWYGPHQLADWRYRSLKEKRDTFGLVDVRSPSAQTQMCLSCHMGDAKMGRIVTHAMFAAGHPPLPGFEAQTFGTQMPAHWRRFEDKPTELQADVLKKTPEMLSPGPVPKTRQLLVGGVVNLQQSLQLMHDLAQQSTPLPPGIERPDWPELSVFECSACHHELKTDSWRQKRTTGLIVGRPYPREWATILVEVALEASGRPAQEMHAALSKLNQGLSGRPFGDPSVLVPAYVEAIDWCRKLATELEHRDWKPEDASQVVRAASRLGQERSVEYDTFRQLLWAARTGLGESQNRSESANQVLAELEAFALVDLHNSRLTFRESPAAMADVVKSQRLPLEPNRVSVKLELTGRERHILQLDFNKVLPPIAQYDPRQTQALFGKLAKQLP